MKLPTPSDTFFQKHRSAVMTSVVLALGLILLAVIIGTQTIFAQQAAFQPGIPVQSVLTADYGGARYSTAVAQAGVGLIEDVIRDAEVESDDNQAAGSASNRFATVQAALLTPVPSVTPNPTRRAEQLTALAALPSVTPTASNTLAPTATRTPSGTRTPEPTITPTVSTTATSAPSRTNTRVPNTATSVATATATVVSVIPTATRTNTLIPTNTRTATAVNSATATRTASRTLTPTHTNTLPPTNTASATATRTPSFTPSLTPTRTRTFTQSFTPTPTATRTPTATFTFTPTFTPSNTATSTPSATATMTLTPSATQTPTPTFTATYTPTALPTACIPALADGVNSLAILRAPGPLTIDGNLAESVWQMIYPIHNPVSGSNSNNEGYFALAWDDTYLYYGFLIFDSNTRNDSPAPWNDDSIEAYVDGGNEGSTTYDANDFGFVVGWTDPVLYEEHGQTVGVLFGSANAPGGYSVELAIPWSTIGGTPTVGRVLGVDGVLNDDDNGNDREGQMAWTGTATNFQDTSAYGDGVLVSGCMPLNAGFTFGVSSFTLINADTDQPIAGFDPIPYGAVIDLSNLPTANLNIRANTLGQAGSVRFGYEGNNSYRTDNKMPFALFGDAGNNYDYNAGTLTLGAKTLIGTPYSGSGGSGTAGQPYTLDFFVQD